MELLLQKESGLACFGGKVAPSLNGVDPSLCTHLLDPTTWILIKVLNKMAENG